MMWLPPFRRWWIQGFAWILILQLIAGPASGQEVGGAGYLDQLRGKRQESWLNLQLRYFRGYAHLDRVNKLLNEGKLSEARQEMESYLVTDPKDVEVRYNYLITLYKLKDYEQTILQADLILQERPQFVPAFLYRGLSQQALGHVGKALADFQAAAGQAQITPGDRRFAHNMAADLAIQQKNYDLALRALEQLQSEADFSFFYRRGVALEGTGRLPEAEQMYRQALNQAGSAPNRRLAYSALGELARKRQDWSAASQAFQAVGQLEPDNPEVWRTLAQIAYAHKDYAASVEYIKRALALRPTPQDREFLINLLGFLEDYPEAMNVLNDLLAEAPTQEERVCIYTTLGHAYRRLGKFAEAAQAFQEANKLEKDLPTMEALAQAREQEGRSSQAIAAYQEILMQRPSPQIHLKLGILFEQTGNSEAALSHLKQASAGGGPRTLRLTASRHLGFIYYRLGRFAEAQQSLEHALELAAQRSRALSDPGGARPETQGPGAGRGLPEEGHGGDLPF